jgi:hypothetical protein
MRNLVRALLLGLTGAAAVAVAGDQGAPQAPPGPPLAPPAAATPVPAPAGDIEDFVPSEKVSADDAVSFPVDI